MLAMFDLDGTLTDPYEGITNSVLYALDQLGEQAPEPASLRQFIGPPLQDAFAEVLPAARVDAAVALYRERFDKVGWSENRVYPGIAEMLSQIGCRGHRMLVVTSKPAVFAERILSHFQLHDHFERVVGATLDGTVRHKADLIRIALAGAGATAEDAVMIGDRAQNAIGASANNTRAIGVSWGYAEPGELEAAGVNAIAAAPSEVVRVAGL